jgi:hypothetical protein
MRKRLVCRASVKPLHFVYSDLGNIVGLHMLNARLQREWPLFATIRWKPLLGHVFRYTTRFSEPLLQICMEFVY